MKALVKINGSEKEIEISEIQVNGESVDGFDESKTTTLIFKKSTVAGFRLSWATWNALYKKWSYCCKGPGLNNNGIAEIISIF